MGLKDEKNKDEIRDLKLFSLEFGVDKFYLLSIVTKPNFWKNHLVISDGEAEIALCGVLYVVGNLT